MKTMAKIAALLFLASCFRPKPSVQEIFPFRDVKPGMRIYGKTVYEGNVVSTFSGIVLGKRDGWVNPEDKDNGSSPSRVIVIRIDDAKAEHYLASGIYHGMSGSPVYDGVGRFLGSVSWFDAQEGVESKVDITPAEDMLSIFSEMNRGADVTEKSHDQNFDPPPLPGQPVFVALMYGDLNEGWICTVSYVDSEKFLACGHSLEGKGKVSLSAFGTDIITSVLDRQYSYKLNGAPHSKPFGAVEFDGRDAIAGRLKKSARVFPVSVHVKSGGLESDVHVFVSEQAVMDVMIAKAMVYGIFKTHNMQARLIHILGSITLSGKTNEGRYESHVYRIDRLKEVPVRSEGDLFEKGTKRQETIFYERLKRAIDAVFNPVDEASPDLDVHIDKADFILELLEKKGGYSIKSAAILDSEGNFLDSKNSMMNPIKVRPGEKVEVAVVAQDKFSPKAMGGKLSIRFPDNFAGPAQLVLADGDNLSAWIKDKHAVDMNSRGFRVFMEYLSDKSNKKFYSLLVIPRKLKVRVSPLGSSGIGEAGSWGAISDVSRTNDIEIETSLPELPAPFDFGPRTIYFEVTKSK